MPGSHLPAPPLLCGALPGLRSAAPAPFAGRCGKRPRRRLPGPGRERERPGREGPWLPRGDPGWGVGGSSGVFVVEMLEEPRSGRFPQPRCRAGWEPAPLWPGRGHGAAPGAVSPPAAAALSPAGPELGAWCLPATSPRLVGEPGGHRLPFRPRAAAAASSSGRAAPLTVRGGLLYSPFWRYHDKQHGKGAFRHGIQWFFILLFVWFSAFAFFFFFF